MPQSALTNFSKSDAAWRALGLFGQIRPNFLFFVRIAGSTAFTALPFPHSFAFGPCPARSWHIHWAPSCDIFVMLWNSFQTYGDQLWRFSSVESIRPKS